MRGRLQAERNARLLDGLQRLLLLASNWTTLLRRDSDLRQ